MFQLSFVGWNRRYLAMRYPVRGAADTPIVCTDDGAVWLVTTVALDRVRVLQHVDAVESLLGRLRGA